ncbi:MAG: alpha/beta hydrolase [Verrucomicrobiales bacterium]
MKTTLPLLLLFACLGSAGFTAAADYDPLATVKEAKVAVSDAEVEDTGRDRAIPIRIYLPESGGKHALILFSHGLGGSRENNAYVAEHWAKRGFAVAAMQHAGSDAAVWKDAPAAKRFGALQKAANLESFMDRAADVKAVLDQLAKWNGEDKHLLKGRLDMERVGMSGHSFGAVTTQAVSGQSFPLRGRALTDDRIDAAVAFSPSRSRNRASQCSARSRSRGC